MKKFILFVIIIVFTFLAVGCQQTPEEEAVINKQNLEEKMKNNNNSVTDQENGSAYETTKRAEDVIAVRDQWNYDNGISVSMDAEFIKPNAMDFPVARIQTRIFSRDEIEKTIEFFFSGRTMYKPWEESKQDIAEEIIQLKQIINDPSSTEDEIGIAQAMLRSKEAQYAEAPESVEKEELESTDFTQIDPADYVGTANGEEYISSSNDPIYDSLEIWAEKGLESRSVLIAVNAKEGSNSWMMYVDNVEENMSNMSYEFGIDIINDDSIGIEYDDAKKIATDFINELGLDLELSHSNLISKIYKFGDPNEIKQTEIYSSDYKSYQFNYTRSISGVPITFDSATPYGDYDQEYEASTYYEMVSVMVDKNGISRFEYRAPYEITEMIEEDAVIISIDKAIDLFKKHMRNSFAAVSDPEIKAIDVHKIILGLSRIKANDGGYLLVPTYDFFANIQYKNGSEVAVESLDSAYSLCTINAIDGSVIDKNLGY